jgi:hypothetical protein
MGSALSRTNGITEQDRAILELKVQRDKLQHYQLKVSIGYTNYDMSDDNHTLIDSNGIAT